MAGCKVANPTLQIRSGKISQDIIYPWLPSSVFGCWNACGDGCFKDRVRAKRNDLLTTPEETSS
jgi:hypothetical protein